jgi:YfiH family protein
MLKHTHGKLPFFSYEIFQPFDSVSSVFSTRVGGVSEPPYHTLNLGMSVGDRQDNVIQNRTLFCEAIGVDIRAITVGHLIQGTHIEIVSPAERGRGGIDSNNGLPGTDGMITCVPDVALLLLVADCAAISFFDPKRKVIGLGHGGWRGTVGGIARKVVQKMNEAFDCNPADILVGVSPSIGPCCYEVREDVVQAFQQAFPEQAHTFFVHLPDGSIHLDVWTALKWQLLASGIQPDHMEFAGTCTACHTDVFYSHRAEKGKTGRFGGLITLKTMAA